MTKPWERKERHAFGEQHPQGVLESERERAEAKRLCLGARVRIIESADTGGVDAICGVIADHTRWLDGSERFGVQYWHQGERKSVNCERRELEVIDQ